ncbi:TonB-dependent receptor [Niabella terrae]
MRNLMLLLLLSLPVALMAQKNTGSVKGTVYDSINDYALSAASVSVFKQADSTVTDFQLSDENGAFTIAGLALKTPFYFIITHTGYRPFVRAFALDSSQLLLDLGKINMQVRGADELEEVVIKAVQPLRMNGDTLEINPDAFKLDSNAVVEDMLMRVPGLTVWGDGTITMNGRQLEKVYVDGKPFFGGATQTATQNLPKNAIEKIQIYQEKDLSKVQSTDEKTDSLYSMNIKLKEDKKKGIFGKIGAGYGTDEHYTGDGVLQAYDKRNQFGIAVGINNINKEEGTGENAFEQNTFKSNFRIFYGGRGNANDGITRRSYANLKWQHSFSESENSQFYNRLTTDYGYLNTRQNMLSDITNIKTIDDYSLSSYSQNQNLRTSTDNNVKFMYENRKQFGNFLNLTANYTNQFSTNDGRSQTDVYKNDSLATSTAINTNHSETSNDNLNVFGFVRSNDAGQLTDPRKNFMLFFNGGYNNSRTNSSTQSNFISHIDSIPSDLIDRRYQRDNQNYNFSMDFNYDGFRPLIFGIYNFFNIDIALLNEFSVSSQKYNSMVTDYDTLTGQYLQNALLTNDNQALNLNYRPGLAFRKNFSKNVWERYYYWFSAGLELKQQFQGLQNESSIGERNLDRTFSAFTPSLYMNFNYEKHNAFRINTNLWSNLTMDPPSIDELYPIVDSTNRYSITAGNPNLKPSHRQYLNWRLDINRNKRGSKSNYSAGINLNFNNTTDAIGDNTVYDSSGRSVRYLINVDRQTSWNGGFNARFSTELNKRNTLSFSYRNSLSHSSQPGFINYQAAIARNRTISNTLSATYSLIDKFNITLGETISHNSSQQRGLNSAPAEIRNYTSSVNANYFITKAISLNSSLNYQNNFAANGNSVKASIWNANAVYRFMQQKAELTFTAFDLLHQNKNISNFVAENSATTTITNGLQQYFMLTFSYYPRKFGSNNNRRPARPGGMMIIRN